jgi:hypothetical protein
MSQKLLAEEKAKRGMFLSLRELSDVTGIADNKMCRISKESGFPLFEGRVRFVDFEIWYRKKIGFSVDASPLEESTFAMENVPHYVRTYLEGHPGISRRLWEMHKRRIVEKAEKSEQSFKSNFSDAALPFSPRPRRQSKYPPFRTD